MACLNIWEIKNTRPNYLNVCFIRFYPSSLFRAVKKLQMPGRSPEGDGGELFQNIGETERLGRLRWIFLTTGILYFGHYFIFDKHRRIIL